MRTEQNSLRKTAAIFSLMLALPLTRPTFLQAQQADIVQQIADEMRKRPSGQAHQRFAHAKGIVCEGTFQASTRAAGISRAAHFQSGASVPITVRFSDGAPDIAVPDSSPDASPRGMAIRFQIAGRGTDIVALGHNGFIVGNGEDFLAPQKAITETDKSMPHPWPIEAFLGSHPRALEFVKGLGKVPESFVTESYFGNNALIFVNSEGKKQAGRYQIIPADGPRYLDEAAAKAKSPNFLGEELPALLSKAPAKFRLLLQLPNDGDPLNDASVVWPEDRKTIELGILTIRSVVPDSVAAERKLAFDPTRLIEGIELSDDPLPRLRSRVYALSVANRQGK